MLLTNHAIISVISHVSRGLSSLNHPILAGILLVFCALLVSLPQLFPVISRLFILTICTVHFSPLFIVQIMLRNGDLLITPLFAIVLKMN